MNIRLLLYFFGVFFTSMAGGFNPVMTASAWVQLVICSLGAACMAAGAYIDQGPRTGPPAVTSNLSRGTTLGLLAMLVAIVSGCSTRVYGPDGRRQMVTYGNSQAMEFRGPGTFLKTRGTDHSSATKAATDGMSAVGAAAAGFR